MCPGCAQLPFALGLGSLSAERIAATNLDSITTNFCFQESESGSSLASRQYSHCARRWLTSWPFGRGIISGLTSQGPSLFLRTSTISVVLDLGIDPAVMRDTRPISCAVPLNGHSAN